VNRANNPEPTQPSLDDRAGLATYILQVLACPTLTHEQKEERIAEAEGHISHLTALESIAAQKAAGLWPWHEERILDKEAC
jgi:hypothetical protein